MDAQSAFDQHVRTKLEATFGKALAMLIVASASNSTNASPVSLDRSSYLTLCEAIARDQRVQDMWGTSGASDALRDWQALT